MHRGAARVHRLPPDKRLVSRGVAFNVPAPRNPLPQRGVYTRSRAVCNARDASDTFLCDPGQTWRKIAKVGSVTGE